MKKIALSLLLAMIILLAPHAQASSWPARSIKLIVPFAAGGRADTLGRIFAQALSDELGKRVFVENRGGAGGVTASAQVARGEPDGYTLLVSGVASHAIAPALNGNTGYDPVYDFTHIAYMGGPPIVWVVNPSLGARTLSEILAILRSSPTPVNYGSPGTGTQGHLVAAYLTRKLDLPMQPVPYKGAGPAMIDIVAGHIKMLTTSLLEGARSLRILVKTPPDSVGPLVVLKAKNSDALVQKFAEHDVVLSNRHDGLRISFHIYNTPEDVELVLRLLESNLDLLVRN